MEKARDVEVYVVFATSAVIALPSSCCGRLANQKSRWVLPAEARRALRPPRCKSLPPIYKAACPSCLPPSQTSIDTTKHTTSTTYTPIAINSNTSTPSFSTTKFQIHQNDWRQIRRKGQRLQERAIVSRIPSLFTCWCPGRVFFPSPSINIGLQRHSSIAFQSHC